MKRVRFFGLAGLLVLASTAAVGSSLDCQQRNEVGNVLTDVIVVRPASALGTLVGAVAYLGIAPFTALAALAPPHDAFNRVGGMLVGVPYNYAFERKLGEFCD